MMSAFTREFAVIAVGSLMLSACGGGGSSASNDATMTTTTTTTTTTLVATPFSDCFTLTPGVKYTKTDGSKQLIVQEAFEGQTVFGDVELRANDTRFSARYQTISGGFVNFLGVGQYDGAGVSNGKDVYSASARLPSSFAVGQTISITYVNTQTRTTPAPTVTAVNATEQYTFAALETLTLGGRTFTDACKLTLPTGVAGEVAVFWFARGFGAIRSERQNPVGTLVPGSRKELATIVSAPI